MVPNSFEREQKILDYLRRNGNASIQQLAAECGVSNMTVHRDLNKLVESGQVRKRHGGAVRAGAGEESALACAMCGKPASARTIFIVKTENGEEKRACCAHCGLMLQSRLQGTWQSLTVDYLYGHMISAGQAYYLLGSRVSVCCVPSILAFGSRQDAENFQSGFGGTLFGMNEALDHLMGMNTMRSGM